MSQITEPEVPPRTAWDPTSAPWTSGTCLTSHHDRCPRGLTYYPAGINGPSVLVPCACTSTDCPCGGAR